jgi:hypothetical protein
MKILKMLRESDLYTGMIVASSQNEIHLYTSSPKNTMVAGALYDLTPHRTMILPTR